MPPRCKSMQGILVPLELLKIQAHGGDTRACACNVCAGRLPIPRSHICINSYTMAQLHLHHDCRHIQLMASTAPQATLPSLTNLHHPYPIGYVCINSWHQAASPSTSGSPRYLYISRLLIICANNCTSPYSNTHPKQRPPITPTCLSTLGHAFGKGLHHNSQAEGLIYAQIVSSPQLQLIKSIASILMHQLHPQYQQDRW